jgi:hypothetical protein
MVAGNAFAQGGITGNKQGQGGSVVQGAAGTQGSQGDTGLQHCDKPMGALAVVEPQGLRPASLRQYNLQSPVSLIRMMVQQSNCFIVVERGVGMQNAMQERSLQTRASCAGLEHGQAADGDGRLHPDAAGRLLREQRGRRRRRGGRRLRRKAARVAGGLKFKEAQTSMLVADARSGVQVAAAEGSTKKADLRSARALRRRRRRGGRRLRQHQRGQDHRRGVDGQLQQHRRRHQGDRTCSATSARWRRKRRRRRQGDQRDVRAGRRARPKIAGVKLMATPDDAARWRHAGARRRGGRDRRGKNGFVNVQGSTASAG